MVSDVRSGRALRRPREGARRADRARAAPPAAVPRGLRRRAASTATRRRAGATRSQTAKRPRGGAAPWRQVVERDAADAARAAARARRRLDRHDRPERGAPAQGGGRQDAPRGSVGKLAITFLTYGFKHGAPRDADLLFDVRFLPNPHYESDLRPLTGLDAAVREYVESSDGIGDFYEHLIPLLDYLLPAVREGGQGPPHDRDRLHRRAPPLGGDRRAARARVRRARRLPGRRGPPGHRQAAATP